MRKLLFFVVPLILSNYMKSQTSVYFNGDILTMKEPTPNYAEAIVVKDGKISFIGTQKEAFKLAGEKSRLIDLKGHTLMPGFIDTHGHFIYYGRNLLDCDLKGVKNITELISRMKQHIKNVPKGSWCVGMGYNPLFLEEKRHPTAEELNEISKDVPVLVVHASGHGGSMNNALMKKININSSTKDPHGGEYLRKPGTKEILGGMEETALIEVRNQRPKASNDDIKKMISGAFHDWAKGGQTTAMECGMGLGVDDIDIVRYTLDHKLLPLDLVVFAKESATNDLINAAYSVSQAYKTTPPSNTASELLNGIHGIDKRYIKY
jgi:predicted amidohydrolase YtcJ